MVHGMLTKTTGSQNGYLTKASFLDSIIKKSFFLNTCNTVSQFTLKTAEIYLSNIAKRLVCKINE